MFRVGALILVSVPTFWLGLMGIWLFAVELNLLPSFGIGIKEAILPSIVLGTTTLAITSRQTRSAMIEVLGREYIIAAKAKGLSDRAIIYTHALKNALIPIITVAGMQFGVLIGSAVITETVFSWPGLGKLLVEAIQTKDYPVIQGGILSFAIVFSMVNLIVDIFYVYLDPRLRF
jgi:peptide/nickel transport system permease protein